MVLWLHTPFIVIFGLIDVRISVRAMHYNGVKPEIIAQEFESVSCDCHIFDVLALPRLGRI